MNTPAKKPTNNPRMTGMASEIGSSQGNQAISAPISAPARAKTPITVKGLEIHDVIKPLYIYFG
jgi:hypothetical protein